MHTTTNNQCDSCSSCSCDVHECARAAAATPRPRAALSRRHVGRAVSGGAACPAYERAAQACARRAACRGCTSRHHHLRHRRRTGSDPACSVNIVGDGTYPNCHRRRYRGFVLHRVHRASMGSVRVGRVGCGGPWALRWRRSYRPWPTAPPCWPSRTRCDCASAGCARLHSSPSVACAHLSLSPSAAAFAHSSWSRRQVSHRASARAVTSCTAASRAG